MLHGDSGDLTCFLASAAGLLGDHGQVTCPLYFSFPICKMGRWILSTSVKRLETYSLEMLDES